MERNITFPSKSGTLLVKNRTNMKIGYSRVSTTDQNLDRQLDQLKSVGCERVYYEKLTGTKMNRPELMRMVDALREGDVVVVTELSRLSRSTKDLFSLVEKIHSLGADICSLKETWIDTTTPQGKLLFTMFAGISQFQRDLIRQGTMEGLSSARARGRKGGRPLISQVKIDMAMRMYADKKYSLQEIRTATGISRTTLYRYLKK